MSNSLENGLEKKIFSIDIYASLYILTRNDKAKIKLFLYNF